MSSTKKWVIGCVGCLGVIICAAIIIVVGGVVWFKGSSDKVSEAVLGGPAPAGYVSIGVPLPAGRDGKGPSGLLVLTSQSTRHVVMAIDMPMTAKEMAPIALMEKSDPQSQQVIEKMVTDFMSNAASSGHGESLSADKTVFEGATPVSVSGGKHFPVLRLKTYSESRGTYMPVVLAIVPEADNKSVFLMDMDQLSSSPDKGTDFTASYQAMTGEVSQIVSGTGLAGRLVEINQSLQQSMAPTNSEQSTGSDPSAPPDPSSASGQ